MQILYHIYLSHLLTVFRTWQSSQPSHQSHLSHLSHSSHLSHLSHLFHLSHSSQPTQSSQPSQPFQKNFLLYLPFTLDIGRIQDHRRITERWAKYKRLIIAWKPEKYATRSPLSLLSPPTNPIISFVLPNLSNRQIVKLTNYHYLCTKNIHFFKWHKCQIFYILL